MSKRGPKYKRQRNEKYFTPAWVVDALLWKEQFYGSVCDPAAGAGHIMDVVAAFNTVFGFDVEPDREDIVKADFLIDNMTLMNCVTNPPFGIGGRLAVKFIERALEVTKFDGGKVAMLLPLTFDAGKTRQHLFGTCPEYAGKYVLCQRIRWANLVQKKAGPVDNHAWYVWDHRRHPSADPFVRYVV